MTGNDLHAMVIQERDRHLLRELSVMRVIDREQAKIVAGFGSTTRANARLLALTRAGLLRRFFLGTTAGGAKALYALSDKGARLVEAPESGPRRRQDETVVADFFVQHQMAINDVYCALKYGHRAAPGIAFKRWVGFPKRPILGLRLAEYGSDGTGFALRERHSVRARTSREAFSGILRASQSLPS
jgi:Replication-relaxation